MRFRRSMLITGATMAASAALVAMASPALADGAGKPHPKQHARVTQHTTQTISTTITQTNTNAFGNSNNANVNSQNSNSNNSFIQQFRQ